MYILGIETSCDETAVAVLKAEKGHVTVLSNSISSQVKLHAQFGGVVPNLAAREHAKNIQYVFESSLKEAGVNISDIGLISVTRGPGLGPALVIGIAFAKTLAMKHDLPIVGTNHMEGHIYSNWLLPKGEKAELKYNIFPALNLIVSGGHTELVLMANHGEYEIIGETMDDAVGEAFDKVARLLDLGYPGGPAISQLALMGDPRRYPLPLPMAKSKNFDFSYSGLKTAVLYLIRDLGGKEKLNDQVKADIAASFQESAITVLIQKTKEAAQKYSVASILLSGGVSANSLLRERLSKAAQELGLTYSQPPMAYTTDNAAMIAMAGYMNFNTKKLTTGYQSVAMDANIRLGED